MSQEALQQASEKKEEVKDGTQSVEDLRRKAKELIERKDPANQISSPEDIQENRAWLESNQASRDPKALAAFITNYGKAVQFDKGLLEQWEAKLTKMVQEQKLAPGSMDEYMKWFREQKTGKKMEYLKKSDLDDPKRDKALADFEKEFEKLSEIPGMQAGSLRVRFLNADLQGREKIVAELKKKREVVEKSALPGVVRDEVMKQTVDASVSRCEELVMQLKNRHGELKGRFLELPPLIQQEMKEKFKGMVLPAREAFLQKLEQELAHLSAAYLEKIHEKQQPNAEKHGLTLFSTRSEKDPQSSAALYMHWFTQQLTLGGMRTALAHSDLDSGKRVTQRDTMADILSKESPENRIDAVPKFNAAEMSGRDALIVNYRNIKQSASGNEKRGLLSRLLRKLVLSGGRDDVSKPMETFAVVSEITERRKRFKLTEHAHHDTAQKALERGPSDTLDDTAKLNAKTNLEPLREKDGSIRVKLDTLESHKDARSSWKRVLKPELGDPNAKLAADLTLRTRSGDEVIDERQYQQGELQRELGDVRKALAPLLTDEARAHGVVATEKETKEALEKADWKHLSDEVIRKAA